MDKSNTPQFSTALQKCYKIKKGPISKKYYYTPTLVSLTQDELTLFKIKDVSPSPIARRLILSAEELPPQDKNKFVVKIMIETAHNRQALLLAFDKKEISSAFVTQLNSKNDFNKQLELLKINPNQIEKDVEIGRGAFGIVWKGSYAGGPVAIKEVVTTMNEDKILKEITLLSKINHPNCVRLLGFYKETNNDNKLFIVTELIENGDLHDCIFKKYKNHQISETVKLKILRDVASGILYLHENDVIHRDLKSDNCLVRSVSPSAYQFAVLADFGVSKLLNSAEVNTHTIGIGTPVYMAPDCFKEQYTFALDVYSFGVLINEVFSEERPWSHVETKWTYVLFDKVEKGERPRVLFTNMKDKYPSADKILQLIEKCWKTEPAERPGMKEVIQSLNEIIQSIEGQPKDEKVIEENLKKKVEKFADELSEKLQVSNPSQGNGLSHSTGSSTTKRPPPPRKATAPQLQQPLPPTIEHLQPKKDLPPPVAVNDSDKFNEFIPQQYHSSSQDHFSSSLSVPNTNHSPYNSTGGIQNYYNHNPSSPVHPPLPNHPPSLIHSASTASGFNYQQMPTYPPTPNPYTTSSAPYPPSFPSAPDLVPPTTPDYYQYGTYMPPQMQSLPQMPVYSTSIYPTAPPSPWLSNLPQQLEPCHDILTNVSNFIYTSGGLLRTEDFQNFILKYTNLQEAQKFTNFIGDIFESGGAYIRLESIQKLISYFFPIASDAVPGLSISNVNSVFGCRYFKGFLSGTTIENSLKTYAEAGQYVIRFSTSQGCVALDVLDTSRSCVHLKVQMVESGRVNDQGIIHESIFNWLKYRSGNSYSFPNGATVKLTSPYYF